MFKTLKKILPLCLLLFITLLPIDSFAAEKVLASSYDEFTLDMWHYSGGYWKVGNKGSEKIRINDSELKSIGDLGGRLESDNVASFSVSIPASVKTAVAEGKNVQYRLEENGINLDDLFVDNSYSEPVFSSSTMTFTAKPKFNFSGITLGYNYPGSDKVPLIDKQYGYNIFAIYQGSKELGQADCKFSKDSTDTVYSGYLHPSMIKDSTGALKSGYSFTATFGTMATDGLSIGKGTFANAGACGLSFHFPVKVVFYYDDGQPESTDPATPTDPTDPDGEEEEQGEAKDASVDAVLGLPSQTYEGHTVIAEDNSSITYDGENYTPTRAYAKHIASNSFWIVESGAGTIRHTTSDEAEATFPKAGNYNVKLKVTCSDASDTDEKPIEVLPTPHVVASIGGSQKQNRKQILTVTAAQNPLYPIVELTIDLKEKSSGESIHIVKQFSGSETAPVNTSNIKYRTIFDNGSNDSFVKVELDFLTKYGVDKDFEYTVYAKDTRGQTDTYTDTFHVVPDTAPVAIIGIEDSYIRSAGKNIAPINVTDQSTTDGDQLERTWYFSTDNTNFSPISSFTDNSFGVKQNITFDKTGVGKFYVKLHVKDVWTDDTLPEYIVPSDYLTAETVSTSEVINIAPKVTLSLFKTKTVELLLLAENETQYKAALASKNNLYKALLEEGINADITVESVANSAVKDGTITYSGQVKTSVGFESAWPYHTGFWENCAVTADEKMIYKAEAHWTTPSMSSDDYFGYYAEQPYVIRAYDKNTLSQKWSFTIDKSFLTIDLSKAHFGHDFENQYLYLMAEGKTIIIDKLTGFHLITLNYELGYQNSVTDKYIYSYKADGIYRISRSDGSCKRIISETICAGDDSLYYNNPFQITRLGGEDLFLCKKGNKLYVAHFTPATETINYVYLQGSETDEGLSTSMTIGIDINGRCVVETINYTYNNYYRVNKESGKFVRAFDKDGKLIGKFSVDTDIESITAVRDIKGNINYVSTGQCVSNWKYIMVKLYSVTSGYLAQAYAEAYFLDSENIIAYENNGKVYLGYGCDFTYVATMGPYRCGYFVAFQYDTANKSMSAYRSSTDLLPSIVGNIEYGLQNSNTVLATVGYNQPWGGFNNTYVYNLGETKATKIEKISKRSLGYDSDYTITKTISGTYNIDSIVTAVTNEVNAGGTKAMQVKGTNANASLTKSINLEAGRNYYYEYDTTATTDILSFTSKLSKNGAATSGYTVEKLYREDFNDSEYEQFFTRSSGTVDETHYYMVTKHYSYGTEHGSGTIQFTVPAGYEAVLKFDYCGQTSRSTGKCYFALKTGSGAETRWCQDDISCNWGTQISGSYTSMSLLSSGTYTLVGHLDTSSNFSNNYIYLYIDNIEVSLVKKNSSYPAANQTLALSSSKSKNGDYTHITGSFTTPNRVASYGLLEADVVSQTISVPKEYTYTVPTGRTALLLRYNVTCRGYNYYNSHDNLRGRLGTAEFNGKTYRFYQISTDSYSCAADYYPSGTYNLYGYNLTGAQKITVDSYDSFSDSTRMVNSVFAVIPKAGASVPSNAANRNFFLAGNNLYYEDITNNGSTSIQLKVGSGTADIANLKIYTIENGQKVYVENSSFKTDSDLTGWSASNATVSIAGKAINMSDAAPLVYKKGEYVSYNINYSDYENDPSKVGYWIYTHEAYNDGTNPISGQVLTEPVHTFYYDGKYTLRHYQYDNTGNAAYDKKSNECTLTFYIEGNGEAPWIEYIKTNPADVESGDNYKLIIGVDDADKDTLNLVVEIFKDGKQIDTLYKNGIKPNKLKEYDPITLDPRADAEVGLYDVVATVSDASGKGIGSYRFTVKIGKTLEGLVGHTDKWNENRAAYNTANPTKKRADNVFWPGESLELTAWLTGGPTKVTAQVQGTSYSIVMTKTSITDDNGRVKYTASLWDKTMEAYFIKNEGNYNVKFTAYYSDGKILYDNKPIIFKYDGGYYQLKKKN